MKADLQARQDFEEFWELFQKPRSKVRTGLIDSFLKNTSEQPEEYRDEIELLFLNRLPDHVPLERNVLAKLEEYFGWYQTHDAAAGMKQRLINTLLTLNSMAQPSQTEKVIDYRPVNDDDDYSKERPPNIFTWVGYGLIVLAIYGIFSLSPLCSDKAPERRQVPFNQHSDQPAVDREKAEDLLRI